jgi:hypothetical protein
LKQCQDDLRRVERESYSDSDRHRAKVELYKNRVRKAEIELEADQGRLDSVK